MRDEIKIIIYEGLMIICAVIVGLAIGLLIPMTFNYPLAPYESINLSNVEFYNNSVLIRLDNPGLGSYAGTGSMLPLLNKHSHGIEVLVKNESEIHVGDIITYNCSMIQCYPLGLAGSYIIHRVIKIGEDSNGKYFILKGDNNPLSDPYKVRFNDVVDKTVAMIW